MGATRISRGFHRLALFLAAIPLLVGGYFSVIYAVGEASMPPAEVWSKPALKIEGFGTVPMPRGFDRLTRDEQDELVDQLAASLRPQWCDHPRTWEYPELDGVSGSAEKVSGAQGVWVSYALIALVGAWLLTTQLIAI